MGKKYEVGQKLFMVYTDRRRGNSGNVVVRKVGRKWVYVSKDNSPYADDQSTWDRFDPRTGEVDAGQFTSWASIFESEDDYGTKKATSKAYINLGKKIEWGAPRAGVSYNDIVEAAKLLGISEEELTEER